MKSRSCRFFLSQLVRISGIIALISSLSSSLYVASGSVQRAGRAGEQIDRLLRHYEKLRLDPQAVARQVRQTGEFLLTTSDQTFDILLEPHDLRAPNYQAEEDWPGGRRRSLAQPSIHTYRGTVPRLEDSEARFTVRDSSVEGVILTRGEWYFVEPLRNFSPAAEPSELVFYRRSDIRLETLGTCATTLAHRIGEAHELVQTLGFGEPRMLAGASGMSIADVATEADYEYVLASGGASEANTTILDILNQVDGIYQIELSVSLQVVYQHAWSTPDDPYVSTSPPAMLGELRDYWNSYFYGIAFDLAHMWTGKNMDGSTIGIAYVAAVCDARSYSYGISQRFTSSPGKYILTAHEIGHNFGATHTEQASPPQTDCSNTIMNTAIGTGFTFCPFSRGEIASHVASNSSCLALGPAAPSNLTAVAASSSQVNLSWQDNSADEIAFTIERKQGIGGTWSQAGTTAANAASFNDTGLGNNTTYFYRVQASGASGMSGYSNEASATTLTSPPTITGILPASGVVGTVVTISGTNFNGATAVKFNMTNATSFTVASPAQITAAVPAGASTGRISVTTPAGTGVSSGLFTVSTNRCDINNDGMTNVLDIQLLINAILGIPGSPANGDLNRDGNTNVLDLQLLINIVLGLGICPG